MKKRSKSSTNLQNKRRMLVFLLCFFLTTVALIVRLGYLQIVVGEEYKKQAMDNWAKDIKINAKRGIIYDAKGKQLAVSVPSNKVVCIPSDVKKTIKVLEAEGKDVQDGFKGILKFLNKFVDVSNSDNENLNTQIKKPEQIASTLAEILEMDYEEVYEKIMSQQKEVNIKRWITDEQATKIREAQLSGINIVEDNKRVYPYGNFAPHVIGFTNIDQEGQIGVELKFNEYLTGEPGKMIINADAVGRELPYGYSEYYDPKDGLGVVLTIDEVIQHFAESTAEKTKQDYNAKNVTIIAMNPQNGDILAMASKPDFDSNTPRIPLDEEKKEEWAKLPQEAQSALWNEMWRNPAVNDVYEPGSTFKLLTTAIALEENKASLDSTYYCDGYVRQITSARIKCWRYYSPHGQQTLSEAIQNSCNDALAQIGLDIGKETFYDYLKAFGIKEPSGIKLNGEASGIVKNPANMQDVDLVTQAFGQGIAITPIQLTTAVSAIANGGNLMEPRIVKQIVDTEGNIVEEFEPVVRRKVISEETSKIVLGIMKDSAEAGTKQAYRAGYRIGGKSGTAQKVINGRYGDGKYISSFIGAAPVDDPKVVVLVMVDEPDVSIGYYGSIVAGPPAADLIQNILKYYDVEPIYTEEEMSNNQVQVVEVPKLLGLTVKEATDTLISMGLESNITVEVEEDKIVKAQFPKAGEIVAKKSMITMMLN